MTDNATSSELARGESLSQRAVRAGGQPISRLMQTALARPELISLAAGFVDQETLPVDIVRQAADRVLTSDDATASLQYGTNAGLAPLRDRMLDKFRTADRSPASENSLSIDQVVLTAGSNQLLHLVCETLMDPGDIVICASPTYFVFLGALDNLGHRSVGVTSDEQGIIPEALDEELSRRDAAGELNRVKAVYITSYYDNPASTTLAASRRAAVVEIVKRYSHRRRPIYVIEDAAYRELRYSGEDLPSLRAYDEDGRTVIVAQTFSKSFSPGVRVGWGILPEHLVKPLCDQKANIDFGSPNFNQYIMNAVLDGGLYEPHVKRLRAAYRVKMDAMLEAADEHLSRIRGARWLRPSGGLYVWLELPQTMDSGPEGRLLDAAMDEGVMYVPGEYCFPNEGAPLQKNWIRLSFGVQTPQRIRAGIAALARAIENQMRVDPQEV